MSGSDGNCSDFPAWCPVSRLSGSYLPVNSPSETGSWSVSRFALNALPLSENATASQSWRFVALEVRVMSAKKEALQALSIPQNVVWNPFTFRAKEIDESVDRGGDTLVNQRIRLRQFDVAFCCRPKCLKLLDGIFPLI
jgi:hypothetical protein